VTTWARSRGSDAPAQRRETGEVLCQCAGYAPVECAAAGRIEAPDAAHRALGPAGQPPRTPCPRFATPTRSSSWTTGTSWSTAATPNCSTNTASTTLSTTASSPRLRPREATTYTRQHAAVRRTSPNLLALGANQFERPQHAARSAASRDSATRAAGAGRSRRWSQGSICSNSKFAPSGCGGDDAPAVRRCRRSLDEFAPAVVDLACDVIVSSTRTDATPSR
jgi:hypothetical protein